MERDLSDKLAVRFRAFFFASSIVGAEFFQFLRGHGFPKNEFEQSRVLGDFRPAQIVLGCGENAFRLW